MRSRTARASKLAVFILACATAALTLSAQQQAPPAQPGPPAGRGGRAPEPAGPRVKALVVSGGCCHDYALQGKLLVDAISKSLPVDWTIAIQGGRGTTGELPVYDNPNWAKGFDIVVHNECLADVDDPAFIRRITVPQKRWAAGARHPLRDAYVPRRNRRRLARVPRRDDASATPRRTTSRSRLRPRITPS